jgi:hypothetical protein
MQVEELAVPDLFVVVPRITPGVWPDHQNAANDRKSVGHHQSELVLPHGGQRGLDDVLTVPLVPLTTYVPVSPWENLASTSATAASALSEVFSSYRLPSTSNCGRLYVPDAAAVPMKVSLSAADNPTAESTSATSARETIDNLFMLPSLPFVIVHGLLTLVLPAGTARGGPTNVNLLSMTRCIPPL